MQNIGAVASRGTGRIKENHENFRPEGIRADSRSCDLPNTKRDCFFGRDSKSEASAYQADVLPPHHAALDYGVQCCSLVAEMTTNHLHAKTGTSLKTFRLSGAPRAIDCIQDNIPIMWHQAKHWRLLEVQDRAGGIGGGEGARLGCWWGDIQGLVGKPDGKVITRKTWV